MKYARFILFITSLWILQTAPAFSSVLIETSPEDRTETALSVYNQDFALVREVRKASLPKGLLSLRMQDMPARIIAESVQVRSLTAAGDFRVIEQSYENNLPDSGRLLQAYEGKTIKIVRWNEFQDRKEILEARVLSARGEPVYEIAGEIYTGLAGVKIFPALPAEFKLKPAVTWKIASRAKKDHALEIIYLTGGLGWKADYVFSLDEASMTAGLTAWLTLQNQSGTAFKDASLSLIAGRPNSPSYDKAGGGPTLGRMAMAVMDSEAAPSIRESSAFEYHRYDYFEKVSLAGSETRQIKWHEADRLKVRKEYIIEDGQHYFYGSYAGQEQKLPVRAFLEILNTAENKLGLPLPAGQVRIYSGAGREKFFAGEDSIPHTPKDEKIRLSAGEAFDLIAERKQTDYKELTQNLRESEHEITLTNRKNEDVEVLAMESLPPNWKILSESQPHEKLEAFKIQYRVRVPKNSKATVRYRIQTGF